MEPVLTQEELEAIYEAMKTDATPSSTVDDFALTAGTEFVGKAKEIWTNAAKQMRPRMESLIAGSLGKRVKVEVVPAEKMQESALGDAGVESGGGSQTAFLEDPNAVIYVVRFGDTEVLLEIDSGLAKKYIQRRTGAPLGQEDDGEATNQLTMLESRLLRDLVQDLALVMKNAMPANCEPELENVNPEDVLKRKSPEEVWIMIRFAIARLPGSGIALRGPLDLFIPRPEKSRDVIASRLSRARVALSAELGRFQMTVSQLWHMTPGTVVPVETTVGDPIRIFIGGVPKLLGEPFVSRGNLAVRITDRINGASDER